MRNLRAEVEQLTKDLEWWRNCARCGLESEKQAIKSFIAEKERAAALSAKLAEALEALKAARPHVWSNCLEPYRSPLLAQIDRALSGTEAATPPAPLALSRREEG